MASTSTTERRKERTQATRAKSSVSSLSLSNMLTTCPGAGTTVTSRSSRRLVTMATAAAVGVCLFFATPMVSASTSAFVSLTKSTRTRYTGTCPVVRIKANPSFALGKLHPKQSQLKLLFVGKSAIAASNSDSDNKDVDNDTDDICTIQILMSDTGGGHRASANAVRDALDVLYPGKFLCDIVDLYTDYGPVWPYNDYVALYKLMAKYPVTWDIFYHAGATDFGMCVNYHMLDLFCYDSFKKCLDRPTPLRPGLTTPATTATTTTGRRADMVLSVHPLAQDLPLSILADLDTAGKSKDWKDRTTTPFCTIVTDLGSAHPTWFHRGVDKCYVPSDALHQAAKNRGLKEEQIVQYGLPVRRGFWDEFGSGSKVDKAVLRQTLGIDAKLPTVLVVGGGDGMGGLVDISKSLGNKLADSGRNCQMVVVCGNNQQAKQQLESVAWKSGVTVNVQGFVNNMDEWMKASDALVTKAGPGTIAEASICGLPCMLFSYLPGQEEGNIPFVEDAGFGKYSGDPSVIAETVSSWLASPETLALLQQKALAAARPHATLDIARDIAQIAFAAKERRRQQQQSNKQQRQPVVAAAA